MFPPIFATVNVPAVQALLKDGADPLRFYSWGQAPQNSPSPYAVWQLVFGAPENFIGDRPDSDACTTQIDVYVKPSNAQAAALARSIAMALRDAIEPVAHISSWRGESRDPETQDYVYSFDVDWITPR